MFGSTVQELAQILIKANTTENTIEGNDAPHYFDDDQPEHEYWYSRERRWDSPTYDAANFAA
jgi:hypothetical protein